VAPGNRGSQENQGNHLNLEDLEVLVLLAVPEVLVAPVIHLLLVTLEVQAVQAVPEVLVAPVTPNVHENQTCP
jgi:hypothetical protein